MKSLNRVTAATTIGAALLWSCAAIAQTQDTQTSHFVDSAGRPVTVTTGQPAPTNYGPKPSFAQLDPDHDGTISRSEAEAFPPLLNDFDNLAHGGRGISASAYAHWDYH